MHQTCIIALQCSLVDIRLDLNFLFTTVAGVVPVPLLYSVYYYASTIINVLLISLVMSLYPRAFLMDLSWSWVAMVIIIQFTMNLSAATTATGSRSTTPVDWPSAVVQSMFETFNTKAKVMGVGIVVACFSESLASFTSRVVERFQRNVEGEAHVARRTVEDNERAIRVVRRHSEGTVDTRHVVDQFGGTSPTGELNRLELLPKATSQKIVEYNDVCAICLDWMTSARISCCPHLFHEECIRKLFKY